MTENWLTVDVMLIDKSGFLATKSKQLTKLGNVQEWGQQLWFVGLY